MNNITYKNLFIIFSVGLLLNLGIVMNPGYFSHDEISWGLKATSELFLQYSGIFDYKDFHYRPLNFNIWLVLSKYLFIIPQLFHLVLLIWGLVNAILFYFVLTKLNFSNGISLTSALISTIMPSIVFVNGWIGTIGDIGWLFFCLLSFLMFLNYNHRFLGMFFSCVLFVFALMFKETAVIYPGVVFIYLIYENTKRRTSLTYFAAITFIFLVYIYLRFDFLFAKNVSGYNTSLYNIPYRIAEYFIYPFLIKDIEIHGMFSSYSTQYLLMALLCHLFFMFIVCQKKIINYFYYISLYFVASVPMLILSSSLPHYMYGAGYVMAFSLAIVFYRNNFYKSIAALLLLFLAYHSILIQKNFINTGTFQQNMYSSLYSILKSEESVGKTEKCYLLVSEVGTPDWMAVRALFNVDRIKDISIENKKFEIYSKANVDSVQLNSSNCRVLQINKDGSVYE